MMDSCDVHEIMIAIGLVMHVEIVTVAVSGAERLRAILYIDETHGQSVRGRPGPARGPLLLSPLHDSQGRILTSKWY